MSNRSDPKEKPSLSIVIPLFNEAESLRILHEEIQKTLKKMALSVEVLYIDDGSTDGSFEIIASLHAKDPRVKGILFRRNRGKAEALAAGFERARGDIIVTLDADLQDDPAEIPRLVAKLEEGFDLVSGWKRRRRDPLSKRVASWMYNRMTAWLTGLRLHDFNCGLKAYRREVTQSIPLYGQLHRYIPALAHLAGFRVGELIVHHRPRRYGKSKYGFARITGMFDLVTILFLERYMRRPLHLFGLLGVVAFGIGIGISGYLIVLRILNLIDLSKRPLFLVGVLLSVLGLQFISIGLLGEMISSGRQEDRSAYIKKTLGLSS